MVLAACKIAAGTNRHILPFQVPLEESVQMTSEENPQDSVGERGPSALVPIYAGHDIARGIQAQRRGDRIFYTIRGEPKQVLELIGELDKHGVREVVALITHRSSEGDEEAEDAGGGRDSRVGQD